MNIKTKTEGFDSLVSDEEFEAIKKIHKDFKECIEIHNEVAVTVLHDDYEKMSPYTRIQYMLLSSLYEDIFGYLDRLVNIHTLDKQCIDFLMKSEKCDSLEHYEEKIMLSLLTKRERERQELDEVYSKAAKEVLEDILKNK